MSLIALKALINWVEIGDELLFRKKAVLKHDQQRKDNWQNGQNLFAFMMSIISSISNLSMAKKETGLRDKQS